MREVTASELLAELETLHRESAPTPERQRYEHSITDVKVALMRVTARREATELNRAATRLEICAWGDIPATEAVQRLTGTNNANQTRAARVLQRELDALEATPCPD